MKLSRLALTAYIVAIVIIVVDQFTKAWILGALDMLTASGALIDRELWGGRSISIIEPILRFSFVLNDGVSFGLFGGGAGRWILSVFSIAVSGALAWWALRSDRKLLTAAIGLVMGGALGNVIDRIRFGGVVDFLDFSGTGLFPWVFNVADSAISIGVALLILDGVWADRRKPKPSTSVGDAPEMS